MGAVLIFILLALLWVVLIVPRQREVGVTTPWWPRSRWGTRS